MHLVQRFSIALNPLQKNFCSWSSSQPFDVQITSSSLENLYPFVNSFSIGNKRKSLGVRKTYLITRQLKHWLLSKMPALNYTVTHRIRHSYSYCTGKCSIILFFSDIFQLNMVVKCVFDCLQLCEISCTNLNVLLKYHQKLQGTLFSVHPVDSDAHNYSCDDNNHIVTSEWRSGVIQ